MIFWNLPRGPKSWKISRSLSGIEIFKRDWNEWHFQARLKISSEPPTKPLFLWGILKVKIENFKRDWSFQARLKISSANLKFSSVQARLIFFKIRALWVVTRIAATSKSQIASDCNRNSKKSLRLRKHPLKPTLWTRESPVLCGFYSVSEAPHGSGTPPKYVATTRVWFRIAAIFLAQCDFCDCDTAILLRFLREKLATSKLWLPIASDLWLRLRGSLSKFGIN